MRSGVGDTPLIEHLEFDTNEKKTFFDNILNS